MGYISFSRTINSVASTCLFTSWLFDSSVGFVFISPSTSKIASICYAFLVLFSNVLKRN